MSTSTLPHHAQRVMTLVSQLNPGVFKSVDMYREPDSVAPWQFLRLLPCREWLSHYLAHHQAHIHVESSLSARALAHHQPHTDFITLAAWRTGKTIVRCDMSLFEALQKTGLHHTLPATLLYRLPFWGFYLELPVGQVPLPHEDAGGMTSHGIFFTLSDGEQGRTDVLALVVAERAQLNGQLPVCSLALPLYDVLEQTLDAIKTDRQKRFWQTVLPVLFYLCSENADWGARQAPVRPVPKKVRHGGLRLFEPPVMDFLDVGLRVGSALRQLEQRRQALSDDLSRSGTGTRRLCPHIRRAHWQGYWRGKRQPEVERQFVMKWIAPVFVNAGDDELLQAVVRRLK